MTYAVDQHWSTNVKAMTTIITITGPTCSGKSRLARQLAVRGIPEIRSFTTRAPRACEVNGREYDFLSEAEVDDLYARGEVCQGATINGVRYGSSLRQVQEASASSGACCIVVEPSGVHAFAAFAAKVGWKHLAVYVNNPLERLVGRFLEDRVRRDLSSSLEYAAKRLLAMIEVEHRQWPLDARYDIFIDEMDNGAASVASHTWFIATHIARHVQKEQARRDFAG